MSSMAISQTHVGCLVACSVLGKSAKPFQREMERLLNQNGPEWLANRLKTIWNAACLLRNGDKEAAIALYQANSISYHKGTGYPKGPVKPAVVGFVHAQKQSTIRRFAAVLRYYTSLQLSGPMTPKQLRKAKPAITDEPDPDALYAAVKLAEEALEKAPSSMRKYIKDYSGGEYTPPIRDRYATNLRATSYYYSPFQLPKEVRDRKNGRNGERKGSIPYYHMANSLISTSWVPAPLSEMTPCKEFREQIYHAMYPDAHLSYDEWTSLPCHTECVARIMTIQEQGCKARVVCQPSAWMQLAFQPLHKELDRMIRHFFPKQSCVQDQVKGVYAVRELIAKGEKCYCTDLSSATDRFPREFSIQVLNRLGMENYGQALRAVCESDIQAPWQDDPVHYGTGQPMGLYGSFPLFTLSHLLVCNLAEARVKQQRVNEAAELLIKGISRGAQPKPLTQFQDGTTFKVIGDDVVFSDGDVASEYRGIMSSMDVPISEPKSYTGEVAEFAGFMVVKTNQGVAAFRPYKVPVGDVITNPIDFLANLGSRMARKSPYWRRHFAAFQMTAGERSLDLSPLVPDKEPYGPNPFRGDTRDLSSVSHMLRMLNPRLPDVGDSSYESRHINTIPLFPERGIGDWYGFNPDQLTVREKIRNDLPIGRQISATLSSDPLMKKGHVLRKQREQETSVSFPHGDIDISSIAQQAVANVGAPHSMSEIHDVTPEPSKPQDCVDPEPETPLTMSAAQPSPVFRIKEDLGKSKVEESGKTHPTPSKEPDNRTKYERALRAFGPILSDADSVSDKDNLLSL